MLYIKQRVWVHSYGHTDRRTGSWHSGFCYEADSHKKRVLAQEHLTPKDFTVDFQNLIIMKTYFKYLNIIFISDMFRHCHNVIFSRMWKTVKRWHCGNVETCLEFKLYSYIWSVFYLWCFYVLIIMKMLRKNNLNNIRETSQTEILKILITYDSQE